MAEFLNVPHRKMKEYKQRNSCEDEVQYKKLYRFSKENVEWLADYFIGQNLERRGGGLSPVQKMEVTLRFLSDPGFQEGIAYEMGYHQSTISKTISSTLENINLALSQWIKWPQSAAEKTKMKSEWYTDYNGYPCIIAAIDCTHIRIAKPKFHGDEYINRKGYPSINVQATCDFNYSFTSIDVSYPGSVHDQRIFNNSEIKQWMENSDCILLADEGYTITPYMMIPFRDPLNHTQRHFNKIHCSARMRIEHAFGQLKKRFPCLHYGVRLKLNNIPKAIAAACILHNISKFLKDSDDFEDILVFPIRVPELGNQNESLQRKGKLKREQIVNLLH